MGLLLACILIVPARSQSFSVDTTVTPDGAQYDYAFTLNYDQAGQAQTLTDPIYDWNFFLDPSVPTPTAIALPTGWKYTYDPTSGQFDFYTEGPTGFGNSDFGSYVIQPGASLPGFGLTTPAAPDQSIAFATDEQFNQDANIATLPVATPEPSVWAVMGVGALAGGIMALRRRARQSCE